MSEQSSTKYVPKPREVEYAEDAAKHIIKQLFGEAEIAVAVLIYLYKHCFEGYPDFRPELCTHDMIREQVLLELIQSGRLRGVNMSTARNWIESTLRRFREWGIVECREERFFERDKAQKRKYVYRVKPLLVVKQRLQEVQQRIVETFTREISRFFVELNTALAVDGLKTLPELQTS